MAGIPDTLKGRSFTRVADWSPEELRMALDLADELKVERARRKELRILPGRTVGLIECAITDEKGRLVAKATSTCMTLRGEQASGR